MADEPQIGVEDHGHERHIDWRDQRVPRGGVTASLLRLACDLLWFRRSHRLTRPAIGSLEV